MFNPAGAQAPSMRAVLISIAVLQQELIIHDSHKTIHNFVCVSHYIVMQGNFDDNNL